MGARAARHTVSGASAVVTAAVAAALFTYWGYQPADQFCAAYGVGVSITGEDRIEHEGLNILDHSFRTRDPCGGDDLWHYIELGGVDGVLFDDCQISWVGGGRTKADAIGLDCEP